MNRKFNSLLRKTVFLLGAISLGWAAQAQAQSNTPSDSTHRQGIPHHWGNRNGDFAHRGAAARHWGSREFIHYTPEQRKQVAEINKDIRQRSADLFKKDNSTLKEYKAGLVALQKEKKTRLEALLTQKQKDDIAAARKRRVENEQVMAAAHMERLKLRLNLSDDQVTKIKTGQQDLHSQLKAIHDNDNLLPQQKMEQLKTLMAKRNDTYKSVLTPEQYSQFEKMSHRREGFGGRRGRGEDGSDREGRPGGSEGRPEWQSRS
jgi:Spy/CpxP family protein refolding chaperone